MEVLKQRWIILLWFLVWEGERLSQNNSNPETIEENMQISIKTEHVQFFLMPQMKSLFKKMNKLSHRYRRPHVHLFKRSITQKKMGTGQGQMVRRKHIQMASKHMRGVPAQLQWENCRVTVPPIRWHRPKSLIISCIGEKIGHTLSQALWVEYKLLQFLRRQSGDIYQIQTCAYPVTQAIHF